MERVGPIVALMDGQTGRSKAGDGEEGQERGRPGLPAEVEDPGRPERGHGYPADRARAQREAAAAAMPAARAEVRKTKG